MSWSYSPLLQLAATSNTPDTLISTITDNFDGQTDLDWDLWWNSGYYNAISYPIPVNDQLTLELPASSTASEYSRIEPDYWWSFTNTYVLMEVIQTLNPSTNATAALVLRSYNNHQNIYMMQEGAYLAGGFYEFDVWVDVFYGVTYNSTDHRWWKISESGGTVTFWTSPDGLSWTSQGSAVHRGIHVSFRPRVIAYTYQVETNPGTFIVDNINIPPVSTYSPSGLALLGVG